MTVGGELESEAAIAPWNRHAESGLVHAGQRINATNRFLVEIDHLLRCFSVGHNGNVDREDVARVETGLRRLQRDQRSDHGTCAGQQHEGCSDLYHREDALAAAGAAGDPDAAARQVEAIGRAGRRQAGDKRQNHRGHDGQRRSDPEQAGIDSQIERTDREA